MKEENWITAPLNLLCAALLLVVGLALFPVLTPGATAASAPALTPEPGTAVWSEAREAGMFDWLSREKEEPQSGALPQTLVPVGHTVGIKLFSDGVLVVGLGQVDTPTGAAAPAKTCGLREGDIITHINSHEVDTIEEVQSVLEETSGEKMSIRCLRGDTELQLTTQAAQCSADGSYKLGAWIRDSMAGIGTVTFYDPQSGLFGALGHGVSDVDTARLMPLSSGAILHSSVTGVQKGQVGEPGQLRGAFDLDQDLGQLYANTQSGIFGDLARTDGLPLSPAVPVARKGEVHVGTVTIRSNIKGEEVKEYQAEILRIYPDNGEDTRNFLIKITDPELLDETGGIVQGMSGSPILQDGKLIGAVTHVLVNNPTQGYGIFVENMLKAAQEAA